ncbi:Endonuclease/exonuclease/phosphatase [Phycomyces nitens]|nr:Endonuclease/exonuclease/phosphatase [Phycomyces nitens]
MKGDISVLSLNCWGLYLIASKRQARLDAIADIIANSDHSIVALQEVWVQEDFNIIRTKAHVKLPFAKYFYGGVLGSGLAILSRYPIIESSYHCYKLAGRPLMILHGDYYVGKGCGSVCVEHPEIGIIEVFNTHLHAEYRQSLKYQSHLVSEAWELARLLRASVSQGRQVILAGDLNSTPTTYVYQIITQHGFMTDSWKDVHSSQSSTPIDISNIRSIDSAIIIQSNGVTCSSPFNTWSRNFNKPYAEGTMGKRLDYIFYLSGSRLACIDSCVSVTEQVPRTNMSYSDHFGVHSTFRIIPDISVPYQPIHPCTTKLSPNTVIGIIALLTKEQEKSKKTSRTLLAGFISVVVIGLVMYGLLIGLSVGFGQKPLVPILVPIFCGGGLLFSVAVAPILLIAGFVFGNTEQRAHEQFINDLETFLLGYKDN